MTDEEKRILTRLVKEQIAAGNDKRTAVKNIMAWDAGVGHFSRATVKNYYDAFAPVRKSQ